MALYFECRINKKLQTVFLAILASGEHEHGIYENSCF